jgi:hypothetical protein
LHGRGERTADLATQHRWGAARAVAQPRDRLDMANRMLEEQLKQHEFLAGDSFTIADCAAAPGLFSALAIHAWGRDTHPKLTPYYRALARRPSFAKGIADAWPYRHLFPLPWPADSTATTEVREDRRDPQPQECEEHLVKYLMLIYGNETIWNSVAASDIAQLIRDVEGFNADLKETGELVGVEGLVAEPTSIRVVDGSSVVTDGPYLETKEFVGSYFVVDVESKERALEIARSYPGLRFEPGAAGGLEMWPLMTRGGSDF